MEAPKVLIHGYPTIIEGAFWPLIERLSQDCRVVITTVDYFISPGLVKRLDSLKKEGRIEEYLVIPHPAEKTKFFLFLRAHKKRLRSYHFDLWLTHSEKQIEERYIAECILPKDCVRVVLWQRMTFLFKNEVLARSLLGEVKSGEEGRSSERVEPGRRRKRANSGSLTKNLGRAALFPYRRARRLYKLLNDAVFKRVILSKLTLGKTFRYTRQDLLTEIGSGRADLFIFGSDREAKAHKALFRKPDVIYSQDPAYGSCRCEASTKTKTAILSPLSGFLSQDHLPEECLLLYARDFEIVLRETGAKQIDLRPHPEETGQWSYQLENYLIQRGIPARVVSCEKPLREVACDYLGATGVASCALRDIRWACDRAIVIMFADISKFCYANPKFLFGSQEGIGWIEEGGVYDSAIFDHKKFVPSTSLSIPHILKQLLDNKIKE